MDQIWVLAAKEFNLKLPQLENTILVCYICKAFLYKLSPSAVITLLYTQFFRISILCVYVYIYIHVYTSLYLNVYYVTIIPKV